MALSELNEKIKEFLKDNNVTTIVLVGKSGVGKTWTAQKITEYAKDLSYETLWVSLNRKYDERSFHENIACQLSLLYPTEECEDDDGETEERLENLKQRISSKLEEKMSAVPGEKGPAKDERKRYLLLIVDDVPTKVNEKTIMLEVKSLLHQNQKNLLKVVITRRDSGSCLVKEGTNREIEIDNMRIHQVEPLSENTSSLLFQKRVNTSVSEFPVGTLSNGIIKKSMGFPAAVIMMADALNYIRQHDSGVFTLGSLPEEAASEEDADNNVTWLLSHWYETLPSSIMTNCCWHSRQFFSKHGGVHYNELITYWILEGYFCHTDQIEKAYEEGHHVLMELIDRGMLKQQEDNIVVMEEVTLDMPDHRRPGFGGTASLGLANVFENDEWKGLGRITHTVGMIKTLCSVKKRQEYSTLLIDGSRLCRDVPETYFQDMRVQVLALFNSSLKSLRLSLSTTEKLRLLVLRGCDRLDRIDDFSKLRALTALEISGASSLEKIPDNLFDQMLHLRSLNLSAAPINSLPPLSKLTELRWLILRGCSRLETLPSLKSLKDLEVLDLSGAASLIKIQDRYFSSLRKLQMLDLSETKIDSLPFFQNLGVLTHLLLSGCSVLKKLPNLKPLSSLQILDLSGASNIKEIKVESLENKDTLKILNLSRTSISQLPSNICNLSNLESLDLSDASNLVEIEDKSFDCLRYLRYLNLSNTKVKNLPSLSSLGNLRQLLLKGCSHLKMLPEIKRLTRLEVLDLSGCSSLTEIPDGSFEHMPHLQKLNLSETNIQCLPPFCHTSNLSHLLLKNCKNLKKLPPLDSISKLQELDICGASSLGEIETDFLENMNLLQILNLSESKLKTFPSMSKLINLRQLKLNGCSSFEALQPLEALTKLEVLDLSRTGVGCLPSLEKLGNLRELLLKDCQGLKGLPPLKSLVDLEVLDLSGTSIKEFPYVISELTRLKRLYLPDLKGIQKVDWGKIKRLPEYVNWDQCGIFKTDEILNGNRPSISVRGTEFFQLLRTPELRDSCLKQFYFSVLPLPDQCRDAGIYSHRYEFDLRDIFFQSRHFSYPRGLGCSLEICGFDSFPTGVEVVLKHVEYLSLIENEFISCLSDLDKGNWGVMKGLWVERSTKMKSIFHEEERDVRSGENLDILWASNLPNLDRVCGGNLQSGSFKSLKHFYLDCCPNLINVFHSSLQPENLETLHIKFCDKLESIFERECKLEKLKKLQLLELPELKSIKIDLESLSRPLTVDVRECPKLENLDEILNLGNQG